MNRFQANRQCQIIKLAEQKQYVMFERITQSTIIKNGATIRNPQEEGYKIIKIVERFVIEGRENEEIYTILSDNIPPQKASGIHQIYSRIKMIEDKCEIQISN
jgi:hypothetical protein